MSKEGQTFLAPAQDRDPKINGIRRWDQAFRVYAAIYSKANPHRSAEIWQYVHTINSAAANYVWENVAYYDFTFRQMMSQNPYRSWAKIFNQLWNLAMCTPLQRQTTGGHHFQYHNNPKTHQAGGDSSSRSNTSKSGPRPCWTFNENVACESSCTYDHKCSYCGSYAHSVFDCPKLFNKRGKEGKNSPIRG